MTLTPLKTLKALLLILAAVFLLGLLIDVGLPFAMFIVTFAMGLAIVGPSRWLRWSIVFAIASAAIIAGASYLVPKLPKDSILIGTMTFSLAPLAPAFYLWLGYLARLREPQ